MSEMCSASKSLLKGFFAEHSSPRRYQFETCGNMEGDARPSRIIINQQSKQSPYNYTEKCHLLYIAGSAMKEPKEQINSMSFYFFCNERISDWPKNSITETQIIDYWLDRTTSVCLIN